MIPASAVPTRASPEEEPLTRARATPLSLPPLLFSHRSIFISIPASAMASFEAREDQLFKDEVAKVNEWWKVRLGPFCSVPVSDADRLVCVSHRARDGPASCAPTPLSRLSQSVARSRSRTRRTLRARSSSAFSSKRLPREKSATPTARKSHARYAFCSEGGVGEVAHAGSGDWPIPRGKACASLWPTRVV